jgi:hypothetical protein
VGGLRPTTWGEGVLRCPLDVDFLCLTETWLLPGSSRDEYVPPGFELIVHSCRPCNHLPGSRGAGRHSGGISVYRRCSTSHLWGPANFTEDVAAGIVWVALPAVRLTFAICYFGPPYRSTGIDFDPLLPGITSAQGLGHVVLLLGDFNAWIGTNFCDVPLPSSAASQGEEDLSIYSCIPRDRQCTCPSTNSRGKQLLTRLRACQLVVLNGRISGLHQNNDEHTYHSCMNGSDTLLDYACLSATAFNRAKSLTFHTLPAFEHRYMLLSLHVSPIRSSPTLPRPVFRPNIGNARGQRVMVDRLQDCLPALVSLRASLQTDDFPLGEAVSSLTSIVQSATSSPVFPLAPRQQAPWWDQSCTASKLSLTTAHRMYLDLRCRSGTTVVSVRAAKEVYRQAHTAHKRLCRRKGRDWDLAQEAARIDSFFHSPRTFWNSWQARPRTLPLQDMSVWTAHFRSVLDPELRARPPLSRLGRNLRHSCLAAQGNLLRATQASYDEHHHAFLADLNDPLHEADVALSLAALRNGAAADGQGLTAEALRACWMPWMEDPSTPLPGPYIPAHLLFRTCLHSILSRMWSDPWPPSLTCSVLVPVPKGPPSLDPNRYRGIAVSSVITKLHEHILFTRADEASEQHGMRAPTQCGFRKKHGPLEATFVLNHLITKARHSRRRLCVIFVDFEKAFDLVPREELLARAARLGFHGRFLSALERLYVEVLYKIRVGSADSPPLPSTTGTKQGSHLSPLLFGWFVEQLHGILLSETEDDPGTTIGDHRVPDLLYADDTALVASLSTPLGEVDVSQAQRYLDLLSSFCDIFGMRVNVHKTTAVEFVPSGLAPTPGLTLTYRGDVIPVKPECIYMGLLWKHDQPLFHSHRAHAYVVGLRALHGMLARCKGMGITRPDLLSRLFKILVRSTFSYGCQVWGVATFRHTSDPRLMFGSQEINPGEHLQMMFLRHLAGVGTSAVRLTILAEYGHHPIMHYYLKLATRFWNRTLDADPSSLVHQALLADIELSRSGCRSCWSSFFLRAMHSLGLGGLGLTPSSLVASETRFRIPDLVTALQALAMASFALVSVPRCPRTCSSDVVHMMTYRYWVGMEPSQVAPHCRVSIPLEARHALTRLRLSCSPLEVNTGRFQARPRHTRTCHVCVACPSFALAHPFFPQPAAPPCEDIRHFLLECPLYDLIRGDPLFFPLFRAFTPPHRPPPSSCLRSLLNHPLQALLARCVLRMFSLRSALLSHDVCWGSPHPFIPPPGHPFRYVWFLDMVEHFS